MNKKQLQNRLLTIMGVTGLVVVVVVAVVVLYVVFGVSSFISGSGPKATVDKAYKQVLIPSDLKSTGKTQTGDAVDSPDQLGWQYTYTSNASADTIYYQILAGFRSAGFEVTDIHSSKQDPTLYPAAYSFTASKKTANATFDVEIDAAHNVPRQVNISGLEIHHE